MLVVKTKLKSAGELGLGLFAKEEITKGQLVWIDSPILDLKISEKDFKKLPKLTQDYLKEFSPFDGKNYCLDGDFAKHINHSFKPNINFKEDKAFANKKIKKGEQIFADYSEFDVLFKMGEYGFKVK